MKRAQLVKRSFTTGQLALHLIMAFVAFLFLVPLVWMLVTSFKTPDDILSGVGGRTWIPNPATGENYKTVLQRAEEFPVWRWTANSVFIALAVTAFVLFIDTLAAFAYSRLKWPGRDAMFRVLVATMLVPGQVLLIPAYLLIRGLGWFDTYLALTVPAGASGEHRCRA